MIEQRKRFAFSLLATLLLAVIGACSAPAASAPSASATPSAYPTDTPTSIPPSATATRILPTSTRPPAPSATPTRAAPAARCSPPTIEASSVRLGAWVIYCDENYGFGLRYPTAGIAPQAEGSSVRIELPFRLGTNLSDKYLQIDIATGSGTCASPQSQGYEPGTIQPETVTLNGMAFTKEAGADAGVGNIFEWETYSTRHGSLCISLSFVLHSHNRMMYENPPPEYDHAAESAVFPVIVSTLEWISN